MITLALTKKYFKEHKVLYSQHARHEMLSEEFGEIKEEEVYEAVLSGEVIETYKEDKPYPSILINGITKQKRPIHLVCAYVPEDDVVAIITVYQPDPKKWYNYRRRK